MFVCDECGRQFVSKSGLPVRCMCRKNPVAKENWPLWAKAINRLKNDADKGIGDTVQRVAAWFGADLFKSFAEKLGIPCGCSGRQDTWNRMYPYEAL